MNDILIRFILYGILGWCGEILYTSIHELVVYRKMNWKVRGGVTYLWAFPLYGCLVFLFEPLHNMIRDYPFILRGLIYTLVFFSFEYLAGYISKRIIGRCQWEYKTRLSIHGFIRLDYSFLWFSVGIILEYFQDKFVLLTPYIKEVFLN